jgi:hypothetical protein
MRLKMQATEIQEHARKLMEAHGARAVVEAAQKAVAFENSADAAQACVWRQIETALKQMQGPHQT